MKSKVAIFVFVLLLFITLFLIVFAYKPGTCIKQNGGSYCGYKNQISDCYCDNVCTSYGDCCIDYDTVCLGTNNSFFNQTPNQQPKIITKQDVIGWITLNC